MNKKIIIIIIIIIFSIYSTLFFLENLPFHQQGFDSYRHTALVNSIFEENQYNQNYFPGNSLNDPHIGPYFMSIKILNIVTDIEVFWLFYVFGLINMILLITGLYLLGSIFFNKKFNFLFIILFMLFPATGEFSSILINAHYPNILGFSIFLLIAAKTIKNNNFLQENPILIIILTSLVFISHFLSGLFLILLIGLNELINLLKEKKKKLLIKPLIVLFTLLIASLSWKYYNWISYLIYSTPIQTDTLHSLPLDIIGIISMLSIGIIGIIGFFLEKKNNLLPSKLFLIISIVGLLSFITPFRLAMYWRIIDFIKPFGMVGLIILFKKNYNKISKIAIQILILVLLIQNTIVISNILASDNKFERFNKFADVIPEDSIVYAGPYESYNLAGLKRINTIVYPSDHTNVYTLGVSTKNTEKYSQFINGKLDFSSLNLTTDYILIPTRKAHKLPHYCSITQDEIYSLLKKC